MALKKSLTGIFLALLSLLTVEPVQARQLNVNEALSVARAKSRVPMSFRSPSREKFKLVQTESINGLNTIYILNRDTGGFILLSADEVGAPVLGYSDSGTFDPENVPENMQSWIEYYSAEIADAARAGVGSYQAVAGEDYAAVNPLMNTLWEQTAPYNNLCPLQNNVRLPAGCVATAIAQIMKYHEWPVTGTGSHSYSWNNNGTYETLSLDFSQITFDWANMPDYFERTGTGGIKGTQAQKDAVATLTYAAGIGSNMNYKATGSGASAWNSARALIDNFGYDKRTIYLERKYYTIETWTKMIYDEIAAQRPVYYEGYNYAGFNGTGAGHAFVVDGYDTDGYFHLNWGWGGTSNGYFLLTALDPEDQSTGGSSSGYNGDQAALFGVGKPVEGSEQRFVFYLNGNLSASTNNDKVVFNVSNGYLGMTSTPTAEYQSLEATPGVKVVSVANPSNQYYVWGSATRFTPKWKSGGTLNTFSLPLSSFTGSGEYIVTPAVKYGDNKIEDVVVALGNTGKIKMTTSAGNVSFVADYQPPQLTVTNLKIVDNSNVANKIYPGKKFTISATVTNNGSEYYGYIYPYIYNTSNLSVANRMTDQSVTIPTGASVDVQWDESLFSKAPYADLFPGDYKLTLANASGTIGEPVDVTIEGPVLEITSGHFLDSTSHEFNNNGTTEAVSKLNWTELSLSLNLTCKKGAITKGVIAPTVYAYDEAYDSDSDTYYWQKGDKYGVIPSTSSLYKTITLSEGKSLINLPYKCSINALDTPLEKGHLYLVQVLAQDSDQSESYLLKKSDGTPANYWILYGDQITGVELVSENGGYAVSPNPAVSDITVSAPSPITEVSVYSISGSKAAERKFNGSDTSVHLDVSSLAAGHYILLIRDTFKSGIARLVVM